MGWSGWLWIVLRLLERLSILFDSLFFFIGINRSALVFPAVHIFFGMIGGLDRLVHPKINLPFWLPLLKLRQKKRRDDMYQSWAEMGGSSGMSVAEESALYDESFEAV